MLFPLCILRNVGSEGSPAAYPAVGSYGSVISTAVSS